MPWEIRGNRAPQSPFSDTSLGRENCLHEGHREGFGRVLFEGFSPGLLFTDCSYPGEPDLMSLLECQQELAMLVREDKSWVD